MSTFEEFAHQGMQAIEAKDIETAIASFEQAVALAPDRPDMNNALATAYMHAGRVYEAVSYLERAVELAEPFTAPEHQELKQSFHLELATAYTLTERTADARAVLERAIAVWPDARTPRMQLGSLLLASCQLDAGLAVFREVAQHPGLEEGDREAARALVGSAEAFLESEHPASIFLQGHCEKYAEYFDECAAEHADWYAEAQRMVRGEDGEPKPIRAEGAKPYAMIRVDLVNPGTGEVAGVYSDSEMMVIALNGLEALAQLPILFPWKADVSFEVWVCSQVPWHWLAFTVEFEDGDAIEVKAEALDATIGDWYLAGFNGDFGTQDSGRFHYITDPEPASSCGISYTADFGRARFECIPALLARLSVLHLTHPIRRVLFGRGHLPS